MVAKILLGHPGVGSLSYRSAQALYLATRHHEVAVIPSLSSGGNFNRLWAEALNMSELGAYTHFAMLHADVYPMHTMNGDQGARWLDVLVEELEAYGADLISVPIAIKDSRGVTSCGIGDPSDSWRPFRRFTVMDLEKLPPTFDAAMAGYPGKPLLHNNGMWLADLRKPVFHKPLPNGDCPVYFELFEKLSYDPSQPEGRRWIQKFDSEDWVFSRKLHAIGAKTIITSKVQTVHEGMQLFPNWGGWGDFKHGDEATADKWMSKEDYAALCARRDKAAEADKLAAEAEKKALAARLASKPVRPAEAEASVA